MTCAGIALTRSDLSILDVSRFQSRFTRGDGCWEWKRGTNSAGYGLMRLQSGRRVLAHRMSFVLYSAAIPAGFSNICHTCDNPRCVRPDHLSMGTPLSNAAERDTRLRHPFQRRMAERRAHRGRP